MAGGGLRVEGGGLRVEGAVCRCVGGESGGLGNPPPTTCPASGDQEKWPGLVWFRLVWSGAKAPTGDDAKLFLFVLVFFKCVNNLITPKSPKYIWSAKGSV